VLSAIPEDFYELIQEHIIYAAGFYIAVLNCRYNPNANNLQLFFRGICAGEKLHEFERLEDRETTPRMYDVEMVPATNVPQQILAIMPNRLMEWPEPWDTGSRRIRTMREPFHSICLVWRAYNSLSSMIFSDGVVSDKSGGLMIEME
jgi:hypothetical protein